MRSAVIFGIAAFLAVGVASVFAMIADPEWPVNALIFMGSYNGSLSANSISANNATFKQLTAFNFTVINYSYINTSQFNYLNASHITAESIKSNEANLTSISTNFVNTSKIVLNNASSGVVNVTIEAVTTGGYAGGLNITGGGTNPNSVFFDLSSSSSNVYVRRSGPASSFNWEAYEFGIGNTRVMDDRFIYWGTGYDERMQHETTGNDNLQLGLSLNSADAAGYFSIMNMSNLGIANMSPSTVTKNPTLRIYSNATYSDTYMDFFHDATNARISWSRGGLLIQSETGARSVTITDPVYTGYISNRQYQCSAGGEADSFTCNLKEAETTMRYVCMDEDSHFYQSIGPCDDPHDSAKAGDKTYGERIADLENQVGNLTAQVASLESDRELMMKELCERDKTFGWC